MTLPSLSLDIHFTTSPVTVRTDGYSTINPSSARRFMSRPLSKAVSMDDLRNAIRKVESSVDFAMKQDADAIDGESSVGSSSYGDWSDDVLSVIAPLGEGSGGAVQAVKDERTGNCYARKTIVTRSRSVSAV